MEVISVSSLIISLCTFMAAASIITAQACLLLALGTRHSTLDVDKLKALEMHPQGGGGRY